MNEYMDLTERIALPASCLEETARHLSTQNPSSSLQNNHQWHPSSSRGAGTYHWNCSCRVTCLGHWLTRTFSDVALWSQSMTFCALHLGKSSEVPVIPTTNHSISFTSVQEVSIHHNRPLGGRWRGRGR